MGRRESKTVAWRWHRWWLPVLIMSAGLYTVMTHFGEFGGSLSHLSSVFSGWFVAGLLLLGLTFLTAAAIYGLLAFHRLRFRRTLVVQIAGMFAGRILPAGIGSIGVSYDYLRRQGHTPAQAAAAVGVNNLLGFAGNMLLLVMLTLVSSAVWPHVTVSPRVRLEVIAASLLLVAVVVVTGWYRKLTAAAANVWRQLRHYRLRPGRIAVALLLSVVMALLYGGMLYCAARAVGTGISFAVACIVMSLGVFGSTITPTPGGVGGAEAGLVMGLALYGVPANEALGVAVLYRVLTFWLPLIPGAPAFVFSSRRKYV